MARQTRADWEALILRKPAELVPPAGRILDVGCGYRRIAVPLAAAGHAVWRLDVSPAMIEAATASAAMAVLDIPFAIGR